MPRNVFLNTKELFARALRYIINNMYKKNIIETVVVNWALGKLYFHLSISDYVLCWLIVKQRLSYNLPNLMKSCEICCLA